MGMFDELETSGEARCRHGHVLSDLQFKDMDDPGLARFRIIDGRLIQTQGGWFDVIPDSPVAYTGTLNVYDFCERCDEIVTRSAHHPDGKYSSHPWCEWQLTFEDGALVTATGNEYVLPWMYETPLEAAKAAAALLKGIGVGRFLVAVDMLLTS